MNFLHLDYPFVRTGSRLLPLLDSGNKLFEHIDDVFSRGRKCEYSLFRHSYLRSLDFFSFRCREERAGKGAELFYILSSDIEFACKCTIMRGKRSEGRSSSGNVGTGKEREKRRSRRRGRTRMTNEEETRPEETAIMYATGTHFLSLVPFES